MGPVDRAQNVCQICKARKRACDKGLPACGFCSGRGFPCRYDVDAPQRGRRAYNPGKNFVALPLSPPSSVSHPSEHVPGQDQTLPANTSDRSSPSSLSDGFSVGNSVTEQANRLIAGLGIPRDQIGPRYFQDFRSWPPIISSEFFYSLDPLEPESLQKADVSVLLLTISLLITVLDTTNRSTPASCADTRTLYAATRSLFSQAQASVCASLPLLQAGLLLAECEYVYYRPQAACVNLCTCAGMARILGVPDCLSVICTARSDDVSEKDRANVAWVLVLLERVVLMEMDPVGQPPFTKFPSAETPLPPDGQQNPLQISKAAATVSEIHSPNITPFGRQIQVAFLLDLVLQGLRSADQDEDVRLSRHAVLHRRICTFLQAVMDQESEDKISLALAVSFSIRILFFLNHTTLQNLHSASTDAATETRRTAWAALDTACEMLVDAVRTCRPMEREARPLPCVYSIQNALRHLRERKKVAGGDSGGEIEWLQMSWERYRDKLTLW